MLRLLFRLPVIAWHFGRGGVLGHLARLPILPGWLTRLAAMIDTLIARRNPARPGQALAEALTVLGPAFVKFGQALSTRADLIGPAVAADLAHLQDKLPPFSPVAVRRLIEAESGLALDKCFSQFEEAPVAAASIAQVHHAVLPDGRPVAVKLLRPGIRRRMADDIAVFRQLAKLVESLAPATRRLRLVAAVEQFAVIADQELDLRLEAAAATKLAANMAADRGIHIPWVSWDHTTERMLVLEWVEGIRIDDRTALENAGHDIEQLTTIAARAFFNQVFRDGFFHADMHPGNIFIRADGVLVPVDFGIMGSLSLEDRLFLARLLTALLERDYDNVARLHWDAGMIGPAVSLTGFALSVRAVAEPVLDKPIGEVSLGAVLGQIFGLSRRYDIAVQPQFTLLQKTMVMAEGVGRQLNPDANMWGLARDLAADWMEEHTAIGQRLSQFADRLLELGLRLPQILDRLEEVLQQPPPEPPEPRRPLPWLILLAAGIIIISGVVLVVRNM